MEKGNTVGPAISGFVNKSKKIHGCNIHYWIGGNPQGTPVLLWHGFLGTAYSWHKLMPTLAEAGYAVLVPDMRGYGDSDKPDGDKGYDGRSLANEFRSLVKEIGFGETKPLLLIAHDMGAPPALLWASDHPKEVAALFYMEVPVMLSEVLEQIISYTPKGAANGGMWWWTLARAAGVPEKLVVGREREFLTWFFDGASADPSSINERTINEYLRTFSGLEGVVGAMGVYRAAFTTIEQTEPLKKNKVSVPIIAIGGAKAQGALIKEMVSLVASDVEGQVIPNCGHFVPEEAPKEIFKLIEAFLARQNKN